MHPTGRSITKHAKTSKESNHSSEASPEPDLRHRQPTPEDSRLARGSPQATDATSTRPRLSSGRLRGEATLAKLSHQPTISQEHLMQGSPDILS
jgi:hypothetical protein